MAKSERGATEPERTLRLLWRERAATAGGGARRGPRPRASTDDIVSAALEIADRDGVAAVTMRSVASALGLGAMTLYGYVPGRDELLGLMIDRVAGEGERGGHDGGLPERLRAIADDLMAQYRRHPWLVDVRQPRPWIGPHGSDRYEWQLSAIDGMGFDAIEMDQIVTLVDGFVAGAARHWVAEQERMSLADTDLQWWDATARVLGELMEPGRYPVSGRVGEAAGEEYGLGDADRSYRFGMDRIIAGVEAMRGGR